MDNFYREVILDHYKHPRNFGHLVNPDIVAQEGNVTCGDNVGMEIKIKSSKSKVKSIDDIRFSGEGCAISQASASLLTEKVKGMKSADVLLLHTRDILEMLGTELTPSRIKCAVLPLEVLQKAIGSKHTP